MQEQRFVSSRPRRVAFVVAVVDDLTGERLRPPDVRVSAAGRAAPVVKPEGYHVFIGERGVCEVSACGRRHAPVLARIDAGTLDPLYPVVTLRLQPTDQAIPGASFISGAVVGADGTPAIGASVRVAHRCERYTLKLTRDARKGETHLALYNPARMQLGGARVMLKSKAGGEEMCALTECSDDAWLLNGPLKADHKRSGAEALVLREMMCDSKGRFRMPLRDEEGEITLTAERGGTTASLQIERGQSGMIVTLL